MKLSFNVENKTQPDPFIFEDDGVFYLYVTAEEGVEAYRSRDLLGQWEFMGVVTAFAEGHTFWAPSVIKLEDKYYMYVSCIKENVFEFMHVASADSPLGPFKNEKCLYDHFSIDSHMVKTDKGLYLWYAQDNLEPALKGTRVYIDRFLDPYTPENDPKEVLVPEFVEEQFTPNCVDGKTWYTLEGPFWFQEGQWQYLMYSAGCFQDKTYHIGYAVAKTEEQDLKKVDFVKVTNEGKFAPLMIKNDFEEGTGHHSVIKHRGQYYAVYHGRDHREAGGAEYEERRTARICKMFVSDGRITVERFEDHI